MIVARSIEEVRRTVGAARSDGSPVGFVPTMGFLHRGHLSLIDLARERAEFVVVSIFVNPTQFGPAEDFDCYPRDEERDRDLIEKRGVDLLFAPDRAVIYPEDFSTTVDVGAVARTLEGAWRPGHFAGVATVVMKLLQIVQPDLAVFGQKDAQQCAVIRRMVRDLNLPVEILVGATVREEDGLALSSRNAYLSPEQRAAAPVLYRALTRGAELLREGGASTAEIEKAMSEVVGDLAEIDYLRLVDPETFLPPRDPDRDLLLVGAVRMGSTRLIDNLPLTRSEIGSAGLTGAGHDRRTVNG